MESTNILAISGSLRSGSFNTAAIEAIHQLSPSNIEINIYRELGNIPLFNPDIDAKTLPVINRLIAALRDADGLIIASPEYAHGISGVMKNALDWLVAGEEFVAMPIALINTSPRAIHALASLREILTTMSGVIVDEACLSLPLLGSGMSANDIVHEPTFAEPLQNSLFEFCSAIQASQPGKYSGQNH
ncbi:NADPH-dependent FMN reductase [Lacimicrobium alkaliphilum]|uniref:FMN reductase n=1 Tax=Lacimicrobium alkaliphilum TaxID=1526571 RepID=A0A0U2ZCQ8_9ALTE|nr:NADPH-dependent FMN reductase [Lacimicrobium alkaliphilum]ALS96871.1 FMN reductase [Lacimicrobium alkaliphilum]